MTPANGIQKVVRRKVASQTRNKITIKMENNGKCKCVGWAWIFHIFPFLSALARVPLDHGSRFFLQGCPKSTQNHLKKRAHLGPKCFENRFDTVLEGLSVQSLITDAQQNHNKNGK
jgi:hypothetical protein